MGLVQKTSDRTPTRILHMEKYIGLYIGLYKEATLSM